VLFVIDLSQCGKSTRKRFLELCRLVAQIENKKYRDEQAERDSQGSPDRRRRGAGRHGASQRGTAGQAERIERDPARRHFSFKGATTKTALLIVNRRVRHIPANSIISVFRSDMSRFVTCQETAGFSISLLRPDREWKDDLDLPVRLPGYSRVQGE